MRNYIISSIGNAICRYRAAAIDTLRFDFDFPAFQWHNQQCAVVKPTGNVHQERYFGLLTNVIKVNESSIGPNLSLMELVTRLSERVNERLFGMTTGGNCHTCVMPSGRSGSSRVS